MTIYAAHTDISSDSAAKAAPGALVAVLLSAAAGTAATLILYDNTAASGTVLCSLTALAGDTVTFTPAMPYVATKGIYANIGGSGANATVVYL